MTLRLVLLGTLAFLAYLAVGNLMRAPAGPATAVTLAAVLAAPDRYEGDLVQVAGRVGDRASVLGFGGFRLLDDMGNDILVLGRAATPAPGDPINVTGQFLTAFAVGDVSVPVIFQRGE